MQNTRTWIGSLLILVLVIGIVFFQQKTGIMKSSGHFKIHWGHLGKDMVEKGVIDTEKMEDLYSARGGLTEEYKKLIATTDTDNAEDQFLDINEKNSGFLLNLLWAFGLSNKNPVLEKGPMSDPAYGGAQRFASTGGWSLSKGDSMEHYSKHTLIQLTASQQNLVENIAKNIYRPCCGNSTYFPDCNHGMAMLGLLEIMASQNATEEQMYETAYIYNQYWFPETYENIKKYFQQQGMKENAKLALGKEYSSGEGYRKIVAALEGNEAQGGGGSCGT